MTITPGPWTYDPKSGWINADKCCHRGPMHVADIRGLVHLIGHGHGAHAMAWDDAKAIQDANARLVCAAPDLLAALKGAEIWLSGWDSAEPYLSIIRAAISKTEK